MRHRFALTSSVIAALFSVNAVQAADSLTPEAQQRGRESVPYLRNNNKIAVFGAPSQAELRRAFDNATLRIRSISAHNEALVVTLEPVIRQRIDPPELRAAEAYLQNLPGVKGIGPVYFEGDGLQVSTGRVWVYLPKGTGAAKAQGILSGIGLHLVDYEDAFDGIAVGVPMLSFSMDALIRDLLAAGYHAVPELMKKSFPRLIPSDPYFAKQWSLRNTGDNVTRAGSQAPLEGVAFADARVSEAWEWTTGVSTTLVGVLDSGTDCTHPELAGKCEQPYNAITNKPSAEPPPLSQDMMAGHGTSVAGIIAAPIDGKGMVGVCPSCRIVPVRLIDSGIFLTDMMILRGFKHAVDAGASVINNSWGPSVSGTYLIPVSQGELQGIKYAGQGRGGRGVLVVYAAGNENADTKYLGHLRTGEPNVMGIAASNHRDRRSSYSNFGEFLDISAPTNDEAITPSIISLDIVGAGDLAKDYTSAFGGTSAAAPVVSGIAALMFSLDPEVTAARVREILNETADKVDADRGFWDAQGFSVLYGHGRVNALRAILSLKGQHDPACDAPQAADDCQVHLDENCDGFVDEGCSESSNVGLLCAEASECGPENHWLCPSAGKVRGACTYSCVDMPCPDGSMCLVGRCAPYCNKDNPCPQSDTVCTDEGLGVCLRKCESSTDCPADEICDPVKGYCKLDTDGLPGSPCTSDECKGAQGLCLSEGMGFPDGYCTHACSVNAHCENKGKCIATMNGSFCYKACSFDGDCRQHYVCEQAGPRAGTCYKKCDKDSQCRGTEPGWEHIVCELSTGRCVDTEEPDAGTDAAEDAATEPDGASDAQDEPDFPVEAGVADAATDATGQPEAGAHPQDGEQDDDGCSCRMVGTPTKPWGSLGVMMMAWLWSRRRRRMPVTGRV
ncbi:MAG TPA: S8 family serine peptidase [Polyangiaceae bacterium]|nr:MAG: Calcium-dependent protease precursor [Deltaproteobacteria bacterium ADurb.Bin207]HNS97245.1 S8 family serine peptidase [Polyangiaceae bacterium]HNZ23123.1 S8 family serine peptidase [Polyangiaceae bacterium]HOD22146.1 S8 family serine peptidase [Polyangiaceae bacterium]HOE49404.1 S8 family serine peptidase [Polyangiaceae bacterium]